MLQRSILRFVAAFTAIIGAAAYAEAPKFLTPAEMEQLHQRVTGDHTERSARSRF